MRLANIRTRTPVLWCMCLRSAVLAAEAAEAVASELRARLEEALAEGRVLQVGRGDGLHGVAPGAGGRCATA